MLCHIGYLHAEVASSLVDDKSTTLEDGFHFLALVVEIVESDEVLKKAVEIFQNVKRNFFRE